VDEFEGEVVIFRNKLILALGFSLDSDFKRFNLEDKFIY